MRKVILLLPFSVYIAQITSVQWADMFEVHHYVPSEWPLPFPSFDSFVMTFPAGNHLRSVFPNFSARQKKKKTFVLRMIFPVMKKKRFILEFKG